MPDNDVAIRTYDASQPSFRGFGSLGRLTQDQHRHAKGGGLLLNASGVGEDQIGATHHSQKRKVIQWGQQLDPRVARQQLTDWSANIGIRMDRQRHYYVQAMLNNLADCAANRL